jgi:hypothetical protein
LSKDFLSGLLFIGFGLIALYFGRNLAMGTMVRMGPGWVPHMLAYILMGLGGLICVIALYAGGELAERPKWKPITMVTLGIVLFAVLLERTGMLPALVALVLVSSLGGDEFKLVEVIGNIVVLAILCVVVFKIGLGMNIAVVDWAW